MLIVFVVLIGQGILRIAEVAGDLPLWIDCLIAGLGSAVASILLLKWKEG